MAACTGLASASSFDGSVASSGCVAGSPTRGRIGCASSSRALERTWTGCWRQRNRDRRRRMSSASMRAGRTPPAPWRASRFAPDRTPATEPRNERSNGLVPVARGLGSAAPASCRSLGPIARLRDPSGSVSRRARRRREPGGAPSPRRCRRDQGRGHPRLLARLDPRCGKADALASDPGGPHRGDQAADPIRRRRRDAGPRARPGAQDRLSSARDRLPSWTE